MVSRTPKNFDGIHPPGVTIGKLLPELLMEIGKRSEVPVEAIFREWKFLLGEKMAPFTEPVSFVDGILTVIVKSSTLYSLLRIHEKVRLQKKLQEKFQVRDIVFKIG